MRGLEHRGLMHAEGPIVIAQCRETAAYGELVAVYGRDGARRAGRVVDTSDTAIAVQLFTSNAGLSLDETRLELLGRPLELRVGPTGSHPLSRRQGHPRQSRHPPGPDLFQPPDRGILRQSARF